MSYIDVAVKNIGPEDPGTGKLPRQSSYRRRQSDSAYSGYARQKLFVNIDVLVKAKRQNNFCIKAVLAHVGKIGQVADSYYWK